MTNKPLSGGEIKNTELKYLSKPIKNDWNKMYRLATSLLILHPGTDERAIEHNRSLVKDIKQIKKHL